MESITRLKGQDNPKIALKTERRTINNSVAGFGCGIPQFWYYNYTKEGFHFGISDI
jgi:hypothetical protein